MPLSRWEWYAISTFRKENGAPFEAPSPITLERLQGALDQLGFDGIRGAGWQVFFEFAALTFVLSLPRNNGYASMHTSWSVPEKDNPGKTQLATMLDRWNRERYFPTLYLVERPQGSTNVFADFVVLAKSGLSGMQLNNHLVLGATVCADAIDYVQWSLRALQDA